MQTAATLAFGIVISIAAFQGARWLSGKLRSALVNPVLVATAFIIVILTVFQIPLEDYEQGAQVISFFLGPATAVLAYSVYRQLAILKRHFVPIMCGCLAGSAASMASAYGLCRLFGLDEAVTMSMLPKSVTTPIALSLSEELGGISSVTVAVVIATGIMGSILAPTLIKVFRVKSPVAAGVAIGTCSHAIGTSRAMQIGDVEGAMSGVAIGVSGLLTMVLALVYHSCVG